MQFVFTSPITTLAQFSAVYAPDFSRCTFNNAGNVVSPCVVPVTAAFEPSPGAYNDTLTGDFQGTGRFKGTGILGAANDLNPTLDFPFESYEPLFNLKVEGCGMGTLILHKEGNLNSLHGVWRMVPGSGRGDLLGISGSGTFSQGAPFASYTYVGHVRCGGEHDE